MNFDPILTALLISAIAGILVGGLAVFFLALTVDDYRSGAAVGVILLIAILGPLIPYQGTGLMIVGLSGPGPRVIWPNVMLLAAAMVFSALAGCVMTKAKPLLGGFAAGLLFGGPVLQLAVLGIFARFTPETQKIMAALAISFGSIPSGIAGGVAGLLAAIWVASRWHAAK